MGIVFRNSGLLWVLGSWKSEIQFLFFLGPELNVLYHALYRHVDPKYLL